MPGSFRWGEGESPARFSPPSYMATPGVQKCPICPFPTNRPDRTRLGFVPSRVPRVAHYRRRTKGDLTSTPPPRTPPRRVLSRGGRLKIRVLYCLATFVHVRCTRTRTAIEKCRTVAFSASYSREGKRRASGVIKCASEKEMHVILALLAGAR